MAQRRSNTSTSSNGFPCALVRIVPSIDVELFQQELTRRPGPHHFAKLRAVLVAFDLHLVVAFGLLQERIGLLGVGFERGKARITHAESAGSTNSHHIHRPAFEEACTTF